MYFYFQKYNAKHILEKYFKENIDYKCLLPNNQEQKKKGSGDHNKIKIFMTIKTFKSFFVLRHKLKKQMKYMNII